MLYTILVDNIDQKKKVTKRYAKGYYCMTINPDNEHQYVGIYGKKDRLQLFRNFMNEQLVGWKQFGIEYRFSIELSDVWDIGQGTIGPRLHLHGIIHLCSKKAVKHFLMYELYKLSRFSNTNIDTIEHPTIWTDYCDKQQDIMDNQYLSSNDNVFTECIGGSKTRGQEAPPGANLREEGAGSPLPTPSNIFLKTKRRHQQVDRLANKQRVTLIK